jgi:hypothetical protein
MAIITTQGPPYEIGASLVVDTTAELALLPVDFLNFGSQVYVNEDNVFYTLTNSDDAPGPGIIAVYGRVGGSRWIENGGATGFVTFADLSSTTVDSGATLIGVNSNDGMFSEPDLQHVLQEDVVLKTVLAATDGSGGAQTVGIQDVGSYFTGTNVEAALQELGAKDAGEVTLAALAATTIPSGASLSGVHDTGNYFAGTNLETVTQEIGATDTTQTANIATNTSNIATNTSNIATNTSNIASNASAIALRPLTSDLASTSVSKGASTIGINDAGGLITATQVEAALQEIATNVAANVTAIALRPLTTDLASTSVAKGASTIGVQAGATNVESALAALTTADTLRQTIANPTSFTLTTGLVIDTQLTDAVTNAVSPVMRVTHKSSGTAAIGFGAGSDFWLQNDAGVIAVATRMQSVWLDPSSGAMDVSFSLIQRNGAGFVETFQNSHYNSKTSAGTAALPGWTFLTDATSGMSLESSTLKLGYGGAAQLGMQVGKIGFLAAQSAPVVAASIGASLTNSVTVGGTTNTIDNVVAAGVDTTAAGLVTTRNAIYQLTLKLANIELQLKALGLTVT